MLRRAARAVAAAGPGRWAIFFALAAFVVRFPFLFGRHSPPPGDDAFVFLDLANGLVHGKGFQGHHFWTPGYPAFEAALQIVPRRWEDAIVIVQHLLGVGVTVAVLLGAWRWFGRAVALMAASLVGFTPMLVIHEHTLLPDFLFGTIVLAGAAVLVEAVRRDPPPLRLLVLVGVLFGAATWVKPAGQFLLFAAPPALLFATRDWRRTLKGSALVALVLVLVVSPWIVRNAIDFNLVQMSDQGDRTLFYRVFGVGELPIPTDSADGRFVAAAYARTASQNPAAREHAVNEALKTERGKDEDGAGKLERELALTAIARHPLDYVADSGRFLSDDLGLTRSFEGKNALLTELNATNPPFPKLFPRKLWALAHALVAVWWVVSLHALAGLLALFTGPPERRRATAALVSVWLALSLGTVLTHGGLWRYSVQTASIVFMVGSAGAVIVISAVLSRVRGSPPPTGSRA
ncbi:MAG: hypothetical protein QOD53_1647 [Thermoleophilaceae bacterium]|nr:hypothetical protein [Thermoleophilaceae bacterium]